MLVTHSLSCCCWSLALTHALSQDTDCCISIMNWQSQTPILGLLLLTAMRLRAPRAGSTAPQAQAPIAPFNRAMFVNFFDCGDDDFFSVLTRMHTAMRLRAPEGRVDSSSGSGVSRATSAS